MSTFVMCKTCGLTITDDKCAFATYRKTIDNQEYVFCCANCAMEYEKKKGK